MLELLISIVDDDDNDGDTAMNNFAQCRLCRMPFRVNYHDHEESQKHISRNVTSIPLLGCNHPTLHAQGVILLADTVQPQSHPCEHVAILGCPPNLDRFVCNSRLSFFIFFLILLLSLLQLLLFFFLLVFVSFSVFTMLNKISNFKQDGLSLVPWCCSLQAQVCLGTKFHTSTKPLYGINCTSMSLQCWALLIFVVLNSFRLNSWYWLWNRRSQVSMLQKCTLANAFLVLLDVLVFVYHYQTWYVNICDWLYFSPILFKKKIFPKWEDFANTNIFLTSKFVSSYVIIYVCMYVCMLTFLAIVLVVLGILRFNHLTHILKTLKQSKT